jgi:hypothetical protein
MSQERLATLIADHRAAIARQEAPITHATICDVLVTLAAGQITEGQAIRILAETAERVRGYAPAHVALYQQTIDALRHMQAEEH